jgi:hypothetical protein
LVSLDPLVFTPDGDARAELTPEFGIDTYPTARCCDAERTWAVVVYM